MHVAALAVGSTKSYFALVRFGWRNRLTQLACALLLIALPIYSFRPVLMDLSTIFSVLAIAVALLLPPWRKPLIVLTATCLAAFAGVYACFFSLTRVFHVRVHTVIAYPMYICETIVYALAVIVCLYLHRLLLRQRPAID